MDSNLGVTEHAQEIARAAIEQRNMFAAAFIHACDDEGTYFGLERLYEMAKSVSTKEAEKFVNDMSLIERGY